MAAAPGVRGVIVLRDNGAERRSCGSWVAMRAPPLPYRNNRDCGEPKRMMRLQIMIDELSKRADESDLVTLLATSSQARLYNTGLARELRDVVAALKRELTNELDRRRALALCQLTEVQIVSPEARVRELH